MQPFLVSLWGGMESNHHPWIFSPVRTDHLRYHPINREQIGRTRTEIFRMLIGRFNHLSYISLEET